MQNSSEFITLTDESLKKVTGGYNKMAGQLGADFKNYGAITAKIIKTIFLR